VAVVVPVVPVAAVVVVDVVVHAVEPLLHPSEQYLPSLEEKISWILCYSPHGSKLF